MNRALDLRSVPPARRHRRLPLAEVAGRRVPVATTLRSRLLGLALLRPPCAGEGILIPRCRSVHTFGMRFAIDVVFLDRELRPISVREALAPWRVVADRRAAAVLELPADRRRGARRRREP